MASDSEGTIRSGGSSVRVSRTDAAGEDVESIVELTSKDSIVAIHISPVAGDEETGAHATVQLTVSGPCVVTDGAESDEVLDLASRTE